MIILYNEKPVVQKEKTRNGKDSKKHHDNIHFFRGLQSKMLWKYSTAAWEDKTFAQIEGTK